MFYFRYKINDKQNVPIFPEGSFSGLYVFGGWYYGYSALAFDFPEGYLAEEISYQDLQNASIEVAIQSAEAFTARFFSNSRLLRMTVWLGSYSPEQVPKLTQTHQWIDSITVKAINGDTDFEDPPYSFAEIAAEIANLSI